MEQVPPLPSPSRFDIYAREETYELESERDKAILKSFASPSIVTSSTWATLDRLLVVDPQDHGLTALCKKQHTAVTTRATVRADLRETAEATKVKEEDTKKVMDKKSLADYCY